ncbi:hypothetical protein HMI56_001888 [Coelomomyces lativittatus]|nr:hypothetical protein HMI56_001888 [Coelomomyces lativittatus]
MSHPAQQFRGHATGVNDITCSLDNQLLVTGDSEGMLKLWDPRTTHELLSVTLGPSPINQVVLDPAHSTVAAASQDGHCKIFSIKEQIKRDFIAHQDAVQACLFCPMQPEYLITCSSDHTIKLWN